MSNLFRKQALDKLTAPDRLDERLTLIPPRRWLALAALAFTLAVAALWGTFGRISTQVRGAGMLLEESGFRNIASLAGGVMARLNVQEGDRVEKGDILARLDLFEQASGMDPDLHRAQLTSPVRGTIVNIQKSEGDPVAPGDVVFLLQPSCDDRLVAAAFIPAAQSKNVRPGQPVYVAPSHIEPQRAGYVRGTVRQVGRYPATFQQLVNIFKNRDLAGRLKGDDVVVTIEVDLVPDPGHPTGVRWTGRPPARAEIGAGMICSVAVVVEQRAPVSYVLPWIRATLLGEAPHGPAGTRAP